MTKKRWLVATGLLAAVVCVPLLTAVMLPSSPSVTRANFDRIENEMSKREVQAILGKNSRTMQTNDCGIVIWTTERWMRPDGGRAIIVFVRAGERESIEMKDWIDSTETVTEKIRRWLYL